MRLGAKSGTKVHIINIKNEYSLLELLFFRKTLCFTLNFSYLCKEIERK